MLMHGYECQTLHKKMGPQGVAPKHHRVTEEFNGNVGQIAFQIIVYISEGTYHKVDKGVWSLRLGINLHEGPLSLMCIWTASE